MRGPREQERAEHGRGREHLRREQRVQIRPQRQPVLLAGQARRVRRARGARHRGPGAAAARAVVALERVHARTSLVVVHPGHRSRLPRDVVCRRACGVRTGGMAASVNCVLARRGCVRGGRCRECHVDVGTVLCGWWRYDLRRVSFTELEYESGMRHVMAPVDVLHQQVF